MGKLMRILVRKKGRLNNKAVFFFFFLNINRQKNIYLILIPSSEK